MVTEKDIRFGRVVLSILEQYKVDKEFQDDFLFWITGDAKRIYLVEDLCRRI